MKNRITLYLCILIIGLSFLTFSCDKNNDDDLNNNLPQNNNDTTFTDSRDGRIYKKVKIGNQIWMAENLNYNSSGSSCYDNISKNCDIYGRLYTWNSAMNGAGSSADNPSGVQGVCPPGWHIPSDDEWKELEMYLGMSKTEADNILWRGTNEGSKLAGNASLWNDGDLENDPEFGISGFSGLPGGVFNENNNSLYIGINGIWWTSTENNSLETRSRFLVNYYTTIARAFNNKYHGCSVRCVKD